LPHHYMGEWAARRLIARSRAEDSTGIVSHLAECPLVERGSVAPPSF
jgi:LacI family transcriptional regulator